MAVVSGKLGFAITVETEPGTNKVDILEKDFRGELLTNRQVTEQGSQVVPGLVLANKLSLIGTEYTFNNLSRLVYVKLHGVAWSVSSVEVKHPRLFVTLGRPYNENVS